MHEEREERRQVALLLVDTRCDIIALNKKGEKKPWSSVKLLDEPFITRTLTWLQRGLVDDIFIVGRSDHISWLRSLQRSEQLSDDPVGGQDNVAIRYVIVSKETSCSVGDMLRELDSLHVLQGDFLMIRDPGIMTNMNLEQDIWNIHRENKKRQTKLIMTSFMKRESKRTSTSGRTKGDVNRLVVLNEAHQWLDWCPLNTGTSGTVSIPISFVNPGKDSLIIRSDLSPLGLEMCSPEVLALFTENFDYQSLEDFYSGITTSDILSYTFSVSVVNESVSENVCSGRKIETLDSPCSTFMSTGGQTREGYLKMQRDYLERWIYPVVPERCRDSNILFVDGRLYKFRNTGPTIRQEGCILGMVYLGANVLVEGTVDNSVIYNDVVIQRGVRIENSAIFEGCVIEEAAKVEGCLIGEGVTIKKGIQLRNLVIGPGLVVDKELKAGSIITRESKKGKLALEKVVKDLDRLSIKAGSICSGEGIQFPIEDSEKDESEFDSEYGTDLDNNYESESMTESEVISEFDSVTDSKDSFLYFSNWLPMPMGDADALHEDHDGSSEYYSSDGEQQHEYKMNIKGSTSITTAAAGLKPSYDHFMSEACDTLRQAILRLTGISSAHSSSPNPSTSSSSVHAGLSVAKESILENTALELNALKLGCHVSTGHIREALVRVLIGELLASTGSTGSSATSTASTSTTLTIDRVLNPLIPLFKKFTTSVTLDQLHLLDTLLLELHSIHVVNVLLWIVKTFYERDVVEGDVIIRWYDMHISGKGTLRNTSSSTNLISTVKSLVSWLESNEDSDQSDSEPGIEGDSYGSTSGESESE